MRLSKLPHTVSHHRPESAHQLLSSRERWLSIAQHHQLNISSEGEDEESMCDSWASSGEEDRDIVALCRREGGAKEEEEVELQWSQLPPEGE